MDKLSRGRRPVSRPIYRYSIDEKSRVDTPGRRVQEINLLVRVGNEAELSRFYVGLGFRLDEVVCYGKRLEADEA